MRLFHCSMGHIHVYGFILFGHIPFWSFFIKKWVNMLIYYGIGHGIWSSGLQGILEEWRNLNVWVWCRPKSFYSLTLSIASQPLESTHGQVLAWLHNYFGVDPSKQRFKVSLLVPRLRDNVWWWELYEETNMKKLKFLMSKGIGGWRSDRTMLWLFSTRWMEPQRPNLTHLRQLAAI